MNADRAYASNPATNEHWVKTTFGGRAGTVLTLTATDATWALARALGAR